MPIKKYLAAGGITAAAGVAAGANIMSPFFNDRGASPGAQRENAAIEAALAGNAMFTGGPIAGGIGALAGYALGGSRPIARTFRALRRKGVMLGRKGGELAGKQTFASVSKMTKSLRRSNAVVGGMVGLGLGVAGFSEAAVSTLSPASSLQHDYLDAAGNSDVTGATRRRTGGFANMVKGAVGGVVTYAALGGTGNVIQKSFGSAPGAKALGGFLKNPIVRGIAGIGMAVSMSGMMANTQPKNNRIQGMGY